MDRLLSCECGREHIVSRSQAGQEIKCDCGKIVAIPTLRALAELPLASPAPSTATTSGASRRAEGGTGGAWQGWRGPAMAVATAGFLIATATCSWYGWQRFRIDTSYTVEKEIEAGGKMFDSFDVGALSTVWYEMNTMGLRGKQPPSFFLWNLYAEELWQRALISGGLAAAFGIVALLIGLSARRR